jgi:hypothetical protein
MKGVLSEVTRADPVDQPAVGHGGLSGGRLGCGLDSVGFIRSCLMPELPDAGAACCGQQ